MIIGKQFLATESSENATTIIQNFGLFMMFLSNSKSEFVSIFNLKIAIFNVSMDILKNINYNYFNLILNYMSFFIFINFIDLY